MRRVRSTRTAGRASSVQTLKAFKVWGPKDVASGISVASRPRATVIRPIRCNLGNGFPATQPAPRRYKSRDIAGLDPPRLLKNRRVAE
jgi:hypothetical protein